MNNRFFDELFESIRLIIPNSNLEIKNKDGFILKSDKLITLNENEIKTFKYYTNVNNLELLVKFNSTIKSSYTNILNIMTYMVIFILFILMIFLILYINYLINRPIKYLISLMNKVEKGNLDIDIKYYQDNQFSYIFKCFEKMVNSLKEYIEINYKQKLLTEKSEFKQLQSQIKPYFLYNCFFNITNLCKIEDSETSGILSQKLANYYMYITRVQRDFVMLKEEYQHALDYLEIQKIRFYNKVEINVEILLEEGERVRVPKIILQPILENCYKHTFDKIEEKGILHMYNYCEEKFVKIIIEDNGNITNEII